MSKVKDAMFTDQEPPDDFRLDPDYEEKAEGGTVPPLIFRTMSAVMDEVGAVGKGQRNKQQGFSYRGIDDVYNALHAAMAKHQVFTTSEIVNVSREERTTAKGAVLLYTQIRIRYTFWTVDGSSVSTEVQGEGMDSGDKSSNKAMAVAHKYALLQAFMIPTEQVDPDGESHEVAPRHSDWHQEYDRRGPAPSKPADTFQKPTPSPDVIRALTACEDLETLAEMWSKLSKSDHKLYEGIKNIRKKELQDLASVDDDIPQ